MSDRAILDKSNPASPLSVPLSQTAVLLLDYHQMLFSRIPATSVPGVIKGAQTLRSWALGGGKDAGAGGALVIHGLIDLSAQVPPTFKMAARMAGLTSMLQAKPELADELAEVAAPKKEEAAGGDAREVTLTRTPGIVSAMHSVGIKELLAKHGVRSLVIGGISTSGCAMRTALQAADDGFIVTMIEDACSDPLPEVHDAVVNKIAPMNVHVCTSEEWVKAWTEA